MSGNGAANTNGKSAPSVQAKVAGIIGSSCEHVYGSMPDYPKEDCE
jgi:hypothetical protein